jgi:long-chain acyl-CoA synthetase
MAPTGVAGSTFVPAAAETPDEPAIISPMGERTWAELEQAVRRFANGVRSFGLGHEDRVAILSLNRPEWVEVLLGNHRAGTRHVPVNWHLSQGEVAYILANSRSRLLVVDPEHEEIGRAAATESGVEHVMVAGRDFNDWLRAQEDTEPDITRAGGILMYTSGTTGRPRAVMRSDQLTKVDSVMASCVKVARGWRMTEGGRHLAACPIYHGTPQAMILFSVALKQSLVLMPAFDPEEVLRLIDAHRVTSTHLVPTQLIRMLRLDAEARDRYDLSSLEGVWHGAAPCPEWAKREAIEWLGPILIEYFGSTEGTGPLIATSQEWLDHPGTVGRPVPWIKVSAVDYEGGDLPPGEVGTLYFTRPQGPPTYEGDPEKTAAARLADGRFTVGDVGWIDTDGFVYIADRKIDMIISGGSNIYPSETESVLSEHPDVVDCAVFGIPDDEWGEQVKAAVQLSSGNSTSGEALIAWCKERIAHYKCPRSVDFVDEMPREASGKLKRRALRDPYWQGSGRQV